MSNIIKEIEQKMIKEQDRPAIHPGDTVKIHFKIKEGDRERTQVFQGVIIALNNAGATKTITVRKISFGVGVERIFPLYSPKISKITVVKKGRVRRAKLYYLRKIVGQKGTRIKEKK